MGKLVAVVGNLGAGKTTLVGRLCEVAPLIPLLEDPEVRPFQHAFALDRRRWALANQLDFYMFRAQQEARARRPAGISIIDGGLDQDHRVFSRYFAGKGTLSAAEYGLCESTYETLRSVLPCPDVVIRLDAPLGLLAERRRQRGRLTDSGEHALVDDADLGRFEALLDDWLSEVGSVLRFPSASEADLAQSKIEELAGTVLARLGG